jgi:hypothetical protein
VKSYELILTQKTGLGNSLGEFFAYWAIIHFLTSFMIMTELAKIFGQLFSAVKSYELILTQKRVWATLWANFLPANLDPILRLRFETPALQKFTTPRVA